MTWNLSGFKSKIIRSSCCCSSMNSKSSSGIFPKDDLKNRLTNTSQLFTNSFPFVHFSRIAKFLENFTPLNHLFNIIILLSIVLRVIQAVHVSCQNPLTRLPYTLHHYHVLFVHYVSFDIWHVVHSLALISMESFANGEKHKGIFETHVCIFKRFIKRNMRKRRVKTRRK